MAAPEQLANYIDWVGISRPIKGVAIVGGAAFGSPDDEAWDMVAEDASVIAILKRIALNTAPA